MRLESDKHPVQIVTIHKLKGLEYPLVWLSFITNSRVQDQAFYHDRHSFEVALDLNAAPESVDLAKTERLAKDLRSFYVVLTRPVWHCSLDATPLVCRRDDKRSGTDVHQSALGRLLQKGEPQDAAGLRTCIEVPCDDDIAWQTAQTSNNQPRQVNDVLTAEPNARTLQQLPGDNRCVTSYSGLQQRGYGIAQNLMPRLDVGAAGVVGVVEEPTLISHQLLRSASPGTFLHSLFEDLDFTQPVDPGQVQEKLELGGFESQQGPVLIEWIMAILRAPLNEMDVSLNQLSDRDKQVGMGFYLPISELPIASQLDALIRQFNPPSADCPPLGLMQVRGTLRGSIDLVFRHEGRYYLPDYKSNWLGEDSSAYTQQAIAAAMQARRYDLQYQLYTLALHRYLRHHIVDYDYERHFGGVIYSLLRGVDREHPQQGTYTIRPNARLIALIDEMSAGMILEEA